MYVKVLDCSFTVYQDSACPPGDLKQVYRRVDKSQDGGLLMTSPNSPNIETDKWPYVGVITGRIK